jgi:hypothetical protein
LLIQGFHDGVDLETTLIETLMIKKTIAVDWVVGPAGIEPATKRL